MTQKGNFNLNPQPLGIGKHASHMPNITNGTSPIKKHKRLMKMTTSVGSMGTEHQFGSMIANLPSGDDQGQLQVIDP